MFDLVLPISAIITALSGWLAMWISRKKLKSEEESLIVQSANELVRSAMARIEEMQDELKGLKTHIAQAVLMEEQLRNELRKVKKRVFVLESFIKTQGWEPPAESGDITGHPV